MTAWEKVIIGFNVFASLYNSVAYIGGRSLVALACAILSAFVAVYFARQWAERPERIS